MGDITKDFSYSDFRPYDTATTWLPSNEMLRIKIDMLAENLQKLVEEMDKEINGKGKDKGSSPVGITIISGVRTLADFKRFRRNGYQASRTSDHYFGDPVPLAPGTEKYELYGRLFCQSVGAVDCIPIGMDNKEFFKIAKKCSKTNKCDFGQVIIEYTPQTKDEWIHISNDPYNFFSKKLANKIKKANKYLQTIDGGKTYQIIK